MFSRTFLVHVWRKCRGADCFCPQMIIIPRRALICFARSVPLGRSLNTVGFAGNSFYSRLQVPVVKRLCRYLSLFLGDSQSWSEKSCSFGYSFLELHRFGCVTVRREGSCSRLLSLVKSICLRRELIAEWIRLGVNFSIFHHPLVLWRELFSY